jgi:ABC-type sugar transport system permease subunit
VSLPAGLRRGISPWLFLAPYILFTALFLLYPFLNAVTLSFQQTSGVNASRFVGLENYRFVLLDPDFHRALRNTCVFAFFSVALQLPLSLLFALFLNGAAGRLKVVYRLILFSPFMVGQIFAGILFNVMYAPKYGMVNKVLYQLVGWDVNPTTRKFEAWTQRRTSAPAAWSGVCSAPGAPTKSPVSRPRPRPSPSFLARRFPEPWMAGCAPIQLETVRSCGNMTPRGTSPRSTT